MYRTYTWTELCINNGLCMVIICEGTSTKLGDIAEVADPGWDIGKSSVPSSKINILL